ncbi:ankyrin [Penicillium daleae]|uniref:Ankyrin n=1 Tax=Penicillium daleae TaxID=63821 RepID=A0AAD6G7M9_9EURO|nr:ankyrin [Penicillium daleae]KAJ5461378.1 ankyrin [Penicillium daleae]
MLLDKGADVNAQSDLYGNAFYAALFGGHQEIVELLLDKGSGYQRVGRPIWQCSPGCLVWRPPRDCQTAQKKGRYYIVF